MIEGHAEGRAADLDLAYYTAWHAGLFSQQYRPGKFPDYRKHHPRQKTPTRKTDDELKAAARSFTAAMGGTIQ